MTWLVPMCECAGILSDFGVVVNEKFLELTEQDREQILRRGLSLRERGLALHIEYESYDWWRSANQGIDRFEEALNELERRKKLDAAKRKAKRVHVARRRAEFSALRSDLVLQMLDAGMDYVCAADECSECEDLTVDHIYPLSRGGSDARGSHAVCRPRPPQRDFARLAVRVPLPAQVV